MELEKFDNADASLALTGLITDPVVCARVSPHWGNGLFDSPWENLIGTWCIKHYAKYHKAPGKNIAVAFAHWASKPHDQATYEAVNKFLTQLSGRYAELAESPNSEFVVDAAARHFNKCRALQAQEEIETLLEAGDIDAAYARMQAACSKISLGPGSIINVLEDASAFERAFAQKSEPLIHYQAPADKFFGTALERDGLIGILASSKRGKTRFLIDMAWRAMLERRKVLFIEAGDMSEAQIMRRFASRAARWPILPPRGQTWPFTLEWPLAITREQGSRECTVETEARTFDKPLVAQASWQACQKIIHKRTRTNTPLLKLSVHPNKSLSVAGIAGIMQSLEFEGWTADVLCVDYADLLIARNGRNDFRHQIDEIWGDLRALSQQRHMLVITPTQAASPSFGAETVQKAHFGEARQKFDHITGMLGLSQTPAEKLENILRVNWLDVREMDNDENAFLYCVGLPSLSHPVMASCL